MEERKYVLKINGEPFYYNGFFISSETADSITYDQAKKILFELKRKFEEKGLSFFLIFGTLLGAVRENGFISHDYDVDVATGDYEEMIKFIPEWYKEGFKICRHTDTFMSFMRDGVYIDVYKYQKTTPKKFYASWCCQIDHYIMPKRFFKAFEYIDFVGQKFLVPKNQEELMRWMYGKNWRTPIKGAHGRYEIWPIYYWKQVHKYLSTYVGRKRIKRVFKTYFKHNMRN